MVLAACLQDTAGPLSPLRDDVSQLFLFTLPAEAGYRGHAFVVRQDTLWRGITAFHVAGEEQLYAGVPSNTPTVILRSPIEGFREIRLGRRLSIPTARVVSSAGSQDDVAAFDVIDRDTSRALLLATEMPRIGDTVRVLAMHVGGGSDQNPESGPRRHPALVVTANDSSFRYEYLKSANTNVTSGAAVLDAAGRVVGVNVATVVNGTRVTGIAVGLRALRAHLAEAR
jgi:hypothetical protein